MAFISRLRGPRPSSPFLGANSGRWNPVRLFGDETPTHEVYLGGNTNLLDGHLGRRVRIVGKPMEVLGHAEIWPASIEPVAPSEP